MLSRPLTQIIIIGFLSMTIASLTKARTGGLDGGSGGDEIGLQFHEAFHRAFNNLKSKPELFALLKDRDLERHEQEAKVLVVDTALSVSADGREQFSLAENDLETQTVLINRARWMTLTDAHLLEAIAFHEIASLAGLESTGRYPISEKYLASFQLSTTPIRPIEQRCSAPDSVDSDCETKTRDTSYQTYEDLVADTFYTPRTGLRPTDHYVFRGTRVQFMDENKTYLMQVIDGLNNRNGAILDAEIEFYQPTSVSKKIFMTQQSRRFVRARGKISALAGSSIYLITELDGQNFFYKAWPKATPNDFWSGQNDKSVSQSQLANGALLSITMMTGLNYADPGSDGSILQAITSSATLRPANQDFFEKKVGSRLKGLLQKIWASASGGVTAETTLERMPGENWKLHRTAAELRKSG